MKLSDEQIVHDICFFVNMPNPYKCAQRGYKLPDLESQDHYTEYIDEKGRSYFYE